ncbi:hypothetical protein D3C79_997520 [compost metagenome]
MRLATERYKISIRFSCVIREAIAPLRISFSVAEVHSGMSALRLKVELPYLAIEITVPPLSLTIEAARITSLVSPE